MLDPKELRVGNWVLKVSGVDRESKSFFEYKPIAVDEYLFTFSKLCFPIPLTGDVLGKSGFKHDFGDWYRNIEADGIDEGLPFLRYKHREKCWYLRDMKIPVQPLYLHQLQNLVYALTNQELNVRLDHFENLPIVLN